jgi:hypothetical protein
MGGVQLSCEQMNRQHNGLRDLFQGSVIYPGIRFNIKNRSSQTKYRERASVIFSDITDQKPFR